MIRIFLILCLAVNFTWSQKMIKPEQDYSAQYFIGKGSALIENNDFVGAEKLARNEALKDAAAQIVCKVQTETISKTTSEGKTITEDVFINQVRVETQLDQIMYVTLMSEQIAGYVCVTIGIPKQKIAQNYQAIIVSKSGAMNQYYQSAQLIEDQNPNQALEYYTICSSLIKEFKEYLRIYRFVLGGLTDVGIENLPRPDETVLLTKLGTLSGSLPKSGTAIASEVLAPLMSQLSGLNPIYIYPFGYHNTGFISDFGYQLYTVMRNVLVSNGKNPSERPNPRYRINGQFVPEKDGLLILTELTDCLTNIHVTSQTFLNAVTCNSIGWDNIKPKNYENALRDKIEANRELQKSDILDVKIITDKMSDGPVYYRIGDQPRLAVKTNKECFIRLIYTFADGTNTLLLDNYYLGIDQVNRWSPLPLNLVVVEPTGVEQLLLQASETKMPSIVTTRKHLGDGTFIDVIDIVKTRGLAKKESKSITEVTYVWTIFDK